MYVVRMSSSIDIFASKERPKKLIFRNEKGEEFFFLCKQEKKGDLRKDLRVMEYISIVNRVLSQDEEGKEKHLQLNTFVSVNYDRVMLVESFTQFISHHLFTSFTHITQSTTHHIHSFTLTSQLTPLTPLSASRVSQRRSASSSGCATPSPSFANSTHFAPSTACPPAAKPPWS